jgi:hypothetical protein
VSFAGVAEALEALEAALSAASASLPDDQAFRVYTEPGASVDPPGAVLGPPTFAWEGLSPSPRTATWPVLLVAPAGGDALSALLGLLPAVTQALDETVDCVMQTATPDAYRAGGAELPAYLLQVEVAL